MEALFHFAAASRDDPGVAAWFACDGLQPMVRPWFDMLLGCGADVGALIHDGRPTLCVGSAAFAYVDAYAAHAAIGFFEGASLPDPARLLEGSGKRMRHVKLRLGRPVDEAALATLIGLAYRDMQARVAAGG